MDHASNLTQLFKAYVAAAEQVSPEMRGQASIYWNVSIEGRDHISAYCTFSARCVHSDWRTEYKSVINALKQAEDSLGLPLARNRYYGTHGGIGILNETNLKEYLVPPSDIPQNILDERLRLLRAYSRIEDSQQGKKAVNTSLEDIKRRCTINHLAIPSNAQKLAQDILDIGQEVHELRLGDLHKDEKSIIDEILKFLGLDQLTQVDTSLYILESKQLPDQSVAVRWLSHCHVNR